MKNQPTELVFTSMRAAAAATGIPYAVLSAWKSENFPGFRRDGRIHLRDTLEHVFSKLASAEMSPPSGMRNWREALLKAQAERQALKLGEERGELIRRLWVIEKIRAMFGDIAVMRSKSEAEDAMLFAATNGDPAKCRTIVRQIWDGILTNMNGLKRHLAEESAAQP